MRYVSPPDPADEDLCRMSVLTTKFIRLQETWKYTANVNDISLFFLEEEESKLLLNYEFDISEADPSQFVQDLILTVADPQTKTAFETVGYNCFRH